MKRGRRWPFFNKNEQRSSKQTNLEKIDKKRFLTMHLRRRRKKFDQLTFLGRRQRQLQDATLSTRNKFSEVYLAKSCGNNSDGSSILMVPCLGTNIHQSND